MIVDEYFISGSARRASGARINGKENQKPTRLFGKIASAITLIVIYGKEVRVTALLASDYGPVP